MRKFTLNVVVLLCAVMGCQSVMAASDDGRKEIFSESFQSGLGDFKEEISKGANNIWLWFFAQNKALADAGGVKSDCRLISPEINLLSENIVKFDYFAIEFADLANEFSLSVRKLGGEWTELPLPVADNNGNVVTAEFNIPAEFDNTAVEFGLRYNASKGSILISDFVVSGKEGGVMPDQKADPEIGFAVEEMSYNISTDGAFTAPEFYNPNNLNVTFSSSNGTVAGITEDGALTIILGVGTTEISAVSAETDKFRYSKVSYILTVTDDPTTAIEGVKAENRNDGRIYDLQGRRVNKLGKGIFIVNGKKIILKKNNKC